MRKYKSRVKLAGFVLIGLLCLTFAGSEPGKSLAQTGNQVLKDQGWPRQIMQDGAQIIVHQPQIESWENYIELVARVAITITPKGASKAIIGSAHFKADTQTNFSNRNVLIYNKRLVDTKFDAKDKAVASKMHEIIRKIQGQPEIMSLDRVLAYLEKDAANTPPKPKSTTKSRISLAPPVIFASRRKSSVLVVLDGDPVMAPAKGTDLMYAVNTNWDLFQVKSTKIYYLRHKDVWLKASKFRGPWTPAGTLPDSFVKLPADANWNEVRKNLPGRKISAKKMPTVFVSTKPAELIVTDGKPKHKSIKGTQLKYVKNTNSDLFLYKGDKNYYFLVSGRWFRAKQLTGPWSAASGQLPADFAKIPVNHLHGKVLASVPGTPQAQAAVHQAQIPQRAAVNRKTATINVTYQGEPKFKEIEGTKLSYAVNSAYDVIRLGEIYYVCHKAVWFTSATPKGPWTLSDKIPAEISTIPAKSPVHHVTYVTVYESTPNVVVYGYYPGYMGVYVWGGVVVYGTGWYYPPYIYYGGLYPIYYPYAYSYGIGAYYNPYTGAYARGGVVYGPYGGFGWGAAYNPATGTYARSVGAWGPYGGARVTQAYNPRTGVYAQGGLAYGPGGVTGAASAVNLRTGTSAATRQSANPYAQWGQSVARRGDDWVRTGHYSDSRGNLVGFGTSEGTKGIRFDGSQGRGGTVVKGKDDLYAARNGNVFKRDGSGSWQKYENGGWSNAGLSSQQRQTLNQRSINRPNRPTTQPTQAQRQAARNSINRSAANRSAASTFNRQQYERLRRDSRARSRGTQRTRQYQTNRSRPVRRGGGRRRF